jgi:hypothetical protein
VGSPDATYHFFLAAPTNLFIDLCGSSFDTVAYLRTDANDPATAIDLNDDSYSGGAQGAYNLLISTYTPPCSIISGAIPTPEVEPNNDLEEFSDALDLGSIGAFGETAGKGKASFFLDEADVYKVTFTDYANYSASLDCFDDGNNKVQVVFDLYDGTGRLVDYSPEYGQPIQLGGVAEPGDYYFVVYSIDPGASDGDYKLILQGQGYAPTPTPTETVVPICTPQNMDFGLWGDGGSHNFVHPVRDAPNQPVQLDPDHRLRRPGAIRLLP